MGRAKTELNTDFNLSERELNFPHGDIYCADDIKKFLELLKLEIEIQEHLIWNRMGRSTYVNYKQIIDDLAGEKLV